MQVGTDNIVDKHDIIFPLMRRQLNEARHFGEGYFHQGIMIGWLIVRILQTVTLLHHANH